jgi:hypothetical protein
MHSPPSGNGLNGHAPDGGSAPLGVADNRAAVVAALKQLTDGDSGGQWVRAQQPADNGAVTLIGAPSQQNSGTAAPATLPPEAPHAAAIAWLHGHWCRGPPRSSIWCPAGAQWDGFAAAHWWLTSRLQPAAGAPAACAPVSCFAAAC